MSMVSAIVRPGVDWLKRVVTTIAFRELAQEASAAAGYTIEPPALEGAPLPALPAPTGKRGKQ